MKDSVSLKFDTDVKKINTQVYTNFFNIEQVLDGKKLFNATDCSGILSMAPSRREGLLDNERSFLYHLKTNNFISQSVVGFYFTNSQQKKSHIKFGGWDLSNIKDSK